MSAYKRVFSERSIVNDDRRFLMTGKYDPKLSYKELTSTISALGIKKANTHPWQLFLLGILAGLYIGFGGQLFLVALVEGMGKVAAGAVFSVGLVLVLIAGAELFTGNIIMLVGTVSHFIPIRNTLRNWITVYIGNFVGSFVFAVLIWKSGLLGGPDDLNGLGVLAVKVSQAKLAIPFTQCLIRGIFCNILVILAIIMVIMAKDITSKILCCVLPIMAFVACGFEHCVANMFLIPIGLFAKGIPAFDQFIMFKNILPVTLGNVVGGMFILLIHPNRIRQLQFLLQKYRGRQKQR
jgi:formate transporter